MTLLKQQEKNITRRCNGYIPIPKKNNAQTFDDPHTHSLSLSLSQRFTVSHLKFEYVTASVSEDEEIEHRKKTTNVHMLLCHIHWIHIVAVCDEMYE